MPCNRPVTPSPCACPRKASEWRAHCPPAKWGTLQLRRRGMLQRYILNVNANTLSRYRSGGIFTGNVVFQALDGVGLLRVVSHHSVARRIRQKCLSSVADEVTSTYSRLYVQMTWGCEKVDLRLTAKFEFSALACFRTESIQRAPCSASSIPQLRA
jgi:hypothetical protein